MRDAPNGLIRSQNDGGEIPQKMLLTEDSCFVDMEVVTD